MRSKTKYQFVRFLLILIASLTFGSLQSQDVVQKPSRQEALDYFSKGDYEKAYQGFSILLKSYSRDPLYKYYSGVCLVRMNTDPETAMNVLREAVASSQEIKSVPEDAWFYLGRAQQMSGRFAEAIKSYDRFSSQSGKKSAKQYDVARYIQECNEGKGQVKGSDILVSEVMKKEVPEAAKSKEQETAEKAARPPVVKPVAKPDTQIEKLPDVYDKMLTEGMNYQVKADSLSALAAEYRRAYDNLPEARKPAYKIKISDTESLASKYRKLAVEKLNISNPVIKIDSEQVIPAATAKKPTGKNSAFEIMTDPVKIQNQIIEIDPQIPAGLVYRIQMGVFGKPVSPSFFKGISPVYAFKIPGSVMTRYFAGMFRTAADANKALLKIKQIGFRDSFLVAIADGAPVSMERALTLEKVWGGKPIFSAEEEQGKNPAEAGPPTLNFKVEIMRSVKPLKEEIAESYHKMAGTRSFEILTAENGSTVYLIGKFITFESASEYADLLNRNGYREARVVAYLGAREIPVETAKKLFENTK